MGLFEIYLAGVLVFGSYGAGYCIGEGGNHAVGPAPCVLATSLGAVVWPLAVPAYVVEKSRQPK